MSQQCSECGRQSPLGEPMQHFIGCEHTSQMGDGQAEAQRGRATLNEQFGNSEEFMRGLLEGLSIAKAECDRLAYALDYSGKEYRRPAGADVCSKVLSRVYAKHFREAYPLPVATTPDAGAREETK